MKNFTRNRLVCLTPVKNESWILNLFLKSASLWADDIIIADQLSTDDSRLICNKFPKVKFVTNNTLGLNESIRQNLLLKTARKLRGQKTLIALDTDEFFTPNFGSAEWNLLKQFPPKTIFYFKMHNLNFDLSRYWTFDKRFPLAVVDDGKTEIIPKTIHNNRLPFKENWTVINMNQVNVLHFQYVDPERNRSKMRWYQCWERLNNPKRHPVDIYRQYNHDKIAVNKGWRDAPSGWLTNYKKHDINLKDFKVSGDYWWDNEVDEWFHKYGRSKFRRLDVFHKESLLNTKTTERLLINYLRLTQRFYPKFGIDHFDNLIKKHIPI